MHGHLYEIAQYAFTLCLNLIPINYELQTLYLLKCLLSLSTEKTKCLQN